jgi:RHS repeat-associated protein
VSEERWYSSGGSLIEDVLYTYDDDGNRTTRTTSAGVEQYHYGVGWRLTSIERASTTTDAFTYDDAGRVTSLTRDGHSYALSHNALDQLVSATVDGASTTSWTFDGEDARVGITDALGSRRVIVGPEQGEGLGVPHAITDATGTLQTGYVYAAGRPLLRYSGTSATYYLEDGLGSVIGLADATGAATARIEYDAFGNVRNSMGPVALDPTAAGDFRFRGMWQDRATGLYYVRARMYDAHTGRFLSRDAIEGDAAEVESYVGYQFAYGNPLSFSDPTGAITVNEQMVTQQIQYVLDNLPRAALRELLDEARQGVTSALTDAFVDALVGAVAPIAGPIALGFGSTLSDAGDIFEELVEQGVCGFLGGQGSQWASWLHLAVPLRQSSGQPAANGFGCGSSTPSRARLIRPPGGATSFPDFLISDRPPTQLSSSHRSVLVGDVKLTLGAFGKGRRARRQLRTMIAHARNYGTHIVLLLAFRGTTRAREMRIQTQANQASVYAIIYTLTGHH